VNGRKGRAAAVAVLQDAMVSASRGEMTELSFIAIALAVNSAVASMPYDPDTSSTVAAVYKPFARQAEIALLERAAELRREAE